MPVTYENPLRVGSAPLDTTRPYDHEAISTLPGYIRETRAAMFSTDIYNVAFESNVKTGDAVFIDSKSNIWKRSLASVDPLFADRYRFHGIAHVGTTLRSVRVFGFISYTFWNFPVDHVIYVSPTEVGQLTYVEPDHHRPLWAGTAVAIDALLIDSSLAYWENLRNEIWQARGGWPGGLSPEFPNLNARLDSELQRLINVEVEISNGRGAFANLQARFDHITGRLVLTENELATARGSFASLGLRLDGSDADRVALWNQLGIHTTTLTQHNNRLVALENVNSASRLTSLESRTAAVEDCCDDAQSRLAIAEDNVDGIFDQLDNIYTIPETNDLFNSFSEELENALLAVLDGSALAVDTIWEELTDEVLGQMTVQTLDGNSFFGGAYFLIDFELRDYYVWYEISGAGADPTVASRTGIKVEILTTDSAADVATKTATALSLDLYLTAAALADVVTIDLSFGAPNSIAAGSGVGGFTFNTVTSGSPASITHVAGLPDYFQITAADHLFQGGLVGTLSPRSLSHDLSAVTDEFYELTVNGVVPRLVLVP